MHTHTHRHTKHWMGISKYFYDYKSLWRWWCWFKIWLSHAPHLCARLLHESREYIRVNCKCKACIPRKNMQQFFSNQQQKHQLDACSHFATFSSLDVLGVCLVFALLDLFADKNKFSLHCNCEQSSSANIGAMRMRRRRFPPTTTISTTLEIGCTHRTNVSKRNETKKRQPACTLYSTRKFKR